MKLTKTKRLVIGSSLGLLMSHGIYAQEDAEPELQKEKTEVLRVTGSRIRQIDMETTASMTVFSRDDIEGSGYANISDFLRNSIPSGAMTNIETETLSQVAGSASFGGRDFTADYTLVLLNGRRLPINAIAADFVDLNMIPFAAVERIEYLTDGASAVYGSDAVAGVLNIITRKNFDGVSFTSRLGQASRGDGTEAGWQVVGGSTTNRSNFLIAADYFKREPIAAKDRPLIKSAIAPDGTDGRSPNGLPGYVIRANGDIEPFPDCPADRLDGSNRCQYDFAPLYQAIPKTERHNIYTVFDYELSDYVTFFGEARYGRTYTFNANGAAPGLVNISADSPINPYGEDISLVRRYLDFGPRRTDNTNTSFSLVGGLRGDIGLNHSWEIEATSHRLRNLRVGAGGQINEPAVVEAFNDGVLNPFEFNTFDTAAKQEAFEKIDTTTFREGVSVLQTYKLNLDGLLGFDLGGGPVGYAAGVEFRRESFSDRSDNLSKQDKILGSAGSDGKGERENEAVYAEFLLPVLQNLDLNTAARYDQIDHDEEAVTYKVGVSYAPIDQLKLRASYGTGFKAPNMHDLFLGTSFGVNEAIDPQTCGDNEPCEINVVTGGNQQLEPEESVNYNIGVIGQITPALSLRLDYWDIEIENKVDELDLQSILNDADKFGDLINRDDNGRLNTTGAYVETNLQNLTKETSAGIEMQLQFADKFALGNVSTSLLLNKMVKSKTQQTATDPLCDYADQYNGVDGRLSAGWAQGAYGADVNLRHYGEFVSYSGGFVSGTCTRANPETKFTVEATNQIDLQFSYMAPWDTRFAFGVQNATDEEPAYNKNETWPWYSQTRYSNKGRFYYMQASHEFK
jgi:iron complex outermembrane receptor protein